MDNEENNGAVANARKAQSVGGFQVASYGVKKTKDNEKLRLVLEADVDEITSGEFDMGHVFKALLHHQTGETDVSLRLFMEK